MGTNKMNLARSGDKFLKLYGDRKMVKPLPYLRRVAWLGSNSDQYIVVHVSWDKDDYVSVQAGFLASGRTNTKPVVFTTSLAEFRADFFSNTLLGSIIYNDAAGGGIGYSLNVNGHINLSTDGKIGFDGIFVAHERPVTSSFIGPMYFFGHPEKKGFVGRFYDAKVSVDDTTVLDITPVLDLSGRPAMYDEVSGQLFYNQGTGEFTWGELDATTSAYSNESGGGVNA